MAVLLNSEELGAALMKVKYNKNDHEAVLSFLKIVKPVIKLTVERFPQHLSEDLEQEIKVFLMKKADYLADAYNAGKIKSVTGYFFRMCYNAATTFLKKELKHEDHLMPIDDIKIQPVVKIRVSKRYAVIEDVRIKMLAWIKARWTKEADQIRAGKFVMIILDGKRPSFANISIRKLHFGRIDIAREVYSVVLMKIRELLSDHYEELSED